MAKWRPTGLSTPVGGISGQYSLSDKDFAQQAFDRITTKAIIDAPISMEDPELCVQSADDLQKQMLTLAALLGQKSELRPLLVHVAHACKYFKATAGKDGRNFYDQNGKVEANALGHALGFFRQAVVHVTDDLQTKFGAR